MRASCVRDVKDQLFLSFENSFELCLLVPSILSDTEIKDDKQHLLDPCVFGGCMVLLW